MSCCMPWTAHDPDLCHTGKKCNDSVWVGTYTEDAWTHGKDCSCMVSVRRSDGDGKRKVVIWEEGGCEHRVEFDGTSSIDFTTGSFFKDGPDEVTLRLIGAQYTTRSLHRDQHFAADSKRHRFCECRCDNCYNMVSGCICKECDCGGGKRG